MPFQNIISQLIHYNYEKSCEQKFRVTGDPLSRGHLERFSEGFWSWECVLSHPDALGPHLISFVNAPWFLCTFVSRNSNSYLEDCSWATEACFVPLRRMRRLIHETWWSLKLFASMIQERISLNCLLSGVFSCSVTLGDRTKTDDDKSFFHLEFNIQKLLNIYLML